MTAVVFSSGILKIPGIQQMLGMELVHASKSAGSSPTCVLGWGVRENTEKARRFAEAHSLPFASLEEGFIRSPGLGTDGQPTVSVVCDEIGIHYDATRPSDLEQLLNDDRLLPDAVLEDAKRAMDLMIRHGVSKYSGTVDFDPEQLRQRSEASRHVLVLDQAYADMSVVFGGASSKSFSEMLEAAILENPDAQVWVKAHPLTVDGAKPGYLVEIAEKNGIPVITDHVSPFSLLPHFDRVYAVTSQMGFEALMAGKKVSCFGMPFYAGWGVTDDRIGCNRRHKRRSVLEIFAAAYIMYSRYVHPSTREAATIFDVIEQMAAVRRREKVISGRVFAVAMKRSQRVRLQEGLRTRSNEIQMIPDFRQAYGMGVDRGSRVATWGTELCISADVLVKQVHCSHIVIEDGLLARLETGDAKDSVYSFRIERGSIGGHYGSREASELEQMLSAGGWMSEPLLARSRWLIDQIVEHRITRDGIDAGDALTRKIPSGRKVIVVLGEESAEEVDASGATVQSSYELLRQLRASEPDAFIIYRPHGDSFAGSRFGGSSKRELSKVCDHIESRAGVTHVIDAADEVHVISASSGFFALLRGKNVFCHGLAFYAGWGLTADRMPGHLTAHRTTDRSLEEVVAAAFILHCTYFDGRAGRRCEPEDYVRWLVSCKRARSEVAANKKSLWARLFGRR